jgi:hypothetical protein
MNENPYESPVHPPFDTNMPGPGDFAPRRVTLGAFVLTIIILDLVFSVLRLMLGLLGLSALAVLPQDDPLRQTVFLEVGAAFGMALFGISADTLILLKKRIGIPLAAVKVLFTLVSVFVGVWQATLQFPADMEGPEAAGMTIGFVIGGGCVFVLRIGLLVLYITALVQARRRLAQL